jgi:succinyl-diaminopimelate desuccinylase
MKIPSSTTLDGIDEQFLISACQRVVSTPSESGQEAQVAELFRELFVELGFDTVEIDGNGNVIARVFGQGNGPSVMVNGHIDHVPVGEMINPFSAELVDASRWGEKGMAIYGRGTCDMKCNVVAGAFGIASLKRSGVKLSGDVVLVADIKEEIDSPDGVASVIDRGLAADYGISLESTELAVYVGHRGKVEFDAEITGRTAHSSEPSKGLNAAVVVSRLALAIDAAGAQMKKDDLLGPASLAVTHVRSWPFNDTPLIPDRAVARIDRRYVREETPDSVEAEILAICQTVEAEFPGLRIDLRRTNHYPLMFTDPKSPIVQAALEARKHMTGQTPAVGAWRFGVNGTFMVERGIPTVGIGPGNEKWAHTPEEHVLVDELVSAAELVAMTIARINAVEEPA